MIYLLILWGMAGPVLIGEFQSLDECKKAGPEYLKLIAEMYVNDKRKATYACAGVSTMRPLQPAEFGKA